MNENKETSDAEDTRELRNQEGIEKGREGEMKRKEGGRGERNKGRGRREKRGRKVSDCDM